MTAHDPRVTLTFDETEVVCAVLRSHGDLDCQSHEHYDCRREVYATVERIIAARLAPIRALADEWAEADHEPLTRDGMTVLTVTNRLGQSLRAALDATRADLRASQDHDGPEGQGEGERAGEGDPCAHDWVIDRPESDTWQCIDCDHEGAGVR